MQISPVLSNIRDLIPPSFKFSAIAGVPHKSCKFWWILDFSFQLLWKSEKLPSVNAASKIKFKHQSMTQLGQVLKQIIALIADSRKKDPNTTFQICEIGYQR